MILLVFMTFMGCELGGRLDIQDMGDSGGYFLECYCIPGDRFHLTATLLSPISEPQLLDYSLEFDIYIQGDEQIKLYQSLYIHPDKSFIYNYASPQVVAPPACGYFELFVTGPGGEEIYARTAFPDQVYLDTVRIDKKQVSYTFAGSEHTAFNYYIASVFFFGEDEQMKKATRFHDLSQAALTAEKNTFSVEIPEPVEDWKELRVHLKRVTRENYIYQLAVKELANVNDDNLTSPILLPGNITNSLGIFTGYTEDVCTIVDGKMIRE